MEIIRRGVSLLREQSLISFINEVLKYLRRRIEVFRGYTALSVNNTTAQFVVNERDVICKTRSRLQEEEYELVSILREVSEDDVFYDIGANTGLYSCFVSKRCDRCQVVAFEPYPPNITELKANTNLNNPKRISIFDIALSDTSGTISFSTPEEPTPGHGTGSIAGSPTGESVRTRRGDELISDGEVSPPNIVKIDVEGAEPLVIDGLRKALSNDSCRLVFCELHPPELSEYGYSTSKMVTEFEQMGYDVELYKRWGDGHVLEARRE